MFGRLRGDDDKKSYTVEELLERSNNEDADVRKDAVKRMGKLDQQYEPVVEKLTELKDDDPEKDVRKESKKTLDKLKSKPLSEEYAKKKAGETHTGFDDEVGDPSLEPGEYDLETSMEEEEEDLIEEEAEGKGLRVVIQEKNKVQMDYNGNKVSQNEFSSGTVKVQNTGSRNKITGVDLILNNLDTITTEEPIEEHTHIGTLSPGRENDWKFNYQFEKELEPISISQEYYDPETGLSPNFLGGKERNFEAKIVVKNTTEETIHNIHGEKKLNNLATLNETNITKGEIYQQDQKLVFNINSIDPDEEIEILLELSASLPEDVEIYEAGSLDVSYDNVDYLPSGLEFSSIDGISDFYQRIKRQQRETEPNFYDCEIILENQSEFVYDLNRFSVFAGDIASQQLVLDWEGAEATEDEREIVPSEKLAFEFVFESPDAPPTFGENIEFSVQYETRLVSTTTVTLPSEPLKFMAIAISKAFLDEDGNEVMEYELPSYVETEFPTRVVLTGVGTYPLEALVIRDEIPQNFKAPELAEVSVKRNGEAIASGNYEISAEESETGISELIVNINHLEETEEGGLTEDEEIEVQYDAIAVKPEPREEPIKVQSHGEGYLYEDPETRVYAESEVEGLKLIVVHRRAILDIGKSTSAIDYDGSNAHQIRLIAENSGSSTINIEIKDKIPNGFALVEETIQVEPEASYNAPEDIEGGKVHGWIFENIEPNTELQVRYTVIEETDDADPRELNAVYKG